MGWGCLGLPLSLGTEVFQSLSSSLAVGIPIMQVGGRVCVWRPVFPGFLPSRGLRILAV